MRHLLIVSFLYKGRQALGRQGFRAPYCKHKKLFLNICIEINGSKVAFHTQANIALDPLGKKFVESGSIAFRAGAVATRDSVGVYGAILIPRNHR